MAHPKVSYRRAKAISSSFFLLGAAVLLYTNQWWPGVLLAIGLPLAIRHFLLGRTYDMCLTLAIFVGGYLVSGYDIEWEVLAPVILIIAAIYMILREFLDPEITTEAEDEESLSHEIDESSEK